MSWFSLRWPIQPAKLALLVQKKVREGDNMSNPVSQPVIPPQPNQLYYGVSALALFQTFTRDTYLSAFGIQAPPYDPTRVIKTWFDSL
jgi:hypothetical protein